MHKHYIDMLECPLCHGELKWNIKDENEYRVINAEINCPTCKAEYEVRNEIAVFLTNVLSRNDLWEKGESYLEVFFKENPKVFEALMNTPEEQLNGADYWFKATYFEMKRDFLKSSTMFSAAFEKVYTKDYIDGWNSQMDFITNNIKSDEPVIDIASGKGYLIERLLKNSNNYIVATDFSPTVLERNKEYYKFKGLYDKLSLIAFDARRTPFKDNSISILTSNMGIQNIEQPGEVIAEMNRITKNNFRAVMTFVDNEDKVHMALMKQFNSTAFASRENALETFNKLPWAVKICNSFFSKIKPTPVGEIIKDGGIDGFPIENTVVEFCIIDAEKS